MGAILHTTATASASAVLQRPSPHSHRARHEGSSVIVAAVEASVLFVEQQQDSKSFGNMQRWAPCEVDEVTLRGKRCGNRVAWRQYLGLLERGNRISLCGSGKGSTGQQQNLVAL